MKCKHCGGEIYFNDAQESWLHSATRMRRCLTDAEPSGSIRVTCEQVKQAVRVVIEEFDLKGKLLEVINAVSAEKAKRIEDLEVECTHWQRRGDLAESESVCLRKENDDLLAEVERLKKVERALRESCRIMKAIAMHGEE